MAYILARPSTFGQNRICIDVDRRRADVIGAVGLATGATLFILSVRQGYDRERSFARVVISPGYAGVAGEF